MNGDSGCLVGAHCQYHYFTSDTRKGRGLCCIVDDDVRGDILPEKLAVKLAPIGELDTTRGTLKVKPELTAIFKEYGVWREFD